MMISLKVIDRYIIKQFTFLLCLSLVAFLIIFHVVDVIEKIDKFLKSEMTLNEVLRYYYYQFPFYVNIAIPMSLLLAAVFTIGILGRNNELGAIKASGISLYRISLPLLLIGLLISVGSFFLEDVLVIPASRIRLEIEQNQMRLRRSPKSTIYNNIMFQDSPTRNIVINKFDTRTNTGTTVTIQYFQNNVLVRRIDARRIIWQTDQQRWRLQEFKVRQFDSAGNEILSSALTDSVLNFNLRPEDVIQTSLNPESMRYQELGRFIQRLQESGNDPRKWQVNRFFKIAFPFTNFIVILIGIPLAAVRERNGLSFGAGMSLLAIFTYYGLMKFGQVLGYKGLLSPQLSVWLGNIIFLIGGLWLLYKIRQ